MMQKTGKEKPKSLGFFLRIQKERERREKWIGVTLRRTLLRKVKRKKRLGKGRRRKENFLVT